MDEHGFIRSVHRHLPKKGLTVWKINDNYRGGVPDAYYSGPKADIWIEYKYLKQIPKRAGTIIKPSLRPQQLKWLAKEHSFGRQVYCIVGSKEGGCIFKYPEWVEGIPTKAFNNSIIKQNELAAWICSLTTKGQPP
jgi:hypothetical protein